MTDLAARPVGLFGLDPVCTVAVDRADANGLLVEWGHELGPCDRPFRQDHWVLAVDGRPVSVAITASTVSPTITDDEAHASRVWPRGELAELARICSAPGEAWATRVTLRLWREVLSRRWCWEPKLLVSYSTPGKAGHIYRHDGWRFVRWCRPAQPGKGSTWATGSPTDARADGRKGLWVYEVGAS